MHDPVCESVILGKDLIKSEFIFILFCVSLFERAEEKYENKESIQKTEKF